MSGKSYKRVVSENVEKEYKSFFEDEMKSRRKRYSTTTTGFISMWN